MALAEAFSFDDVALVKDGHRILDGVSDHIHKGATTAIIGTSGSGKSTFLRLLNRFEEPTEGKIRLDGRPLDSYDVHALRRRVSLVAQRPTMLTPSVGQEVRVACPTLSDAEVLQLLKRVALPDMALDRATSTLSGGEQQRLALARSLAVGPEVLLLDEPTSALDEHSAAAVDAVIRSLVTEDLTVVLVSHDLDRVVELADKVLVLENGRLVERGGPRDVRYLR
ncbi:MAG: ATP-binding cassette domain-containing protein [Candidatus Nanopelagicales bacterium]|jgi:putative ABC transport system ATP-binding protein|nr:ATP-binding cassette domain-containing protein [Candidatus Nanopelagicales bacterium]